MTVNRNLLFLLAAVVFFAIAAIAGFGWWDWAARYEFGWAFAGLAAWKAAELP